MIFAKPKRVIFYFIKFNDLRENVPLWDMNTSRCPILGQTMPHFAPPWDILGQRLNLPFPINGLSRSFE